MKTMISVILVLSILLCGCGLVLNEGTEFHDNNAYTIMEKDGVYGLRFHSPKSTSSSGNIQYSEVAPSFTFASPGHMKERILAGNFTKLQLDTLKELHRNSDGYLTIFNLQELYDAVLPAGLQYNEVSWFGGEGYSFRWDKDGMVGTVRVDTESAIKKELDSFYVENGRATIISKNTIQDRNATEICYVGPYGDKLKDIIYTYNENGKDITILEWYELSVSDTIPSSISIAGTVDGVYYYVYISGFSERPSYEWITSFGLKPYVETETE